jgi:hypothetical protein
MAVSTRSAHADPAVTGITIASVPFLIWALFEDTPKTRDPDLLSANVGLYDAVDDELQAPTFGMEYRSNYFLWKFKPIAGVHGSTRGQVIAYAGLRLDAYFARRFVVSPSLAPALYIKGNGKDMGSSGVLRSGLDFSIRFDNRSELGVGFHHMSHGKVFGNKNPGTETIQLFYAMPLDKLFGK